jgi:hypothetical protein
MRLHARALAVLALIACSSRAQTLDSTLLNVISQGGQVNSVIASSTLNNDNPEEAFGFPSGGGPEDGNFLFSDAAAGPDTLTFTTASPVTLYGIRLRAGANGPGGNDARRILTAQLTASPSGVTSGPVTVNDPPIVDTDLFFPAPLTASSFTLTLIREDGAGTRIVEVDALVPEPATPLILLALVPAALFHRRRRRTR